MLAWILAGVVFTACWFAFFVASLLVDEDVNHWNWPTDGGPGLLTNLRMLLLSGLAAAAPAAATWALIHFVV